MRCSATASGVGSPRLSLPSHAESILSMVRGPGTASVSFSGSNRSRVLTTHVPCCAIELQVFTQLPVEAAKRVFEGLHVTSSAMGVVSTSQVVVVAVTHCVKPSRIFSDRKVSACEATGRSTRHCIDSKTCKYSARRKPANWRTNRSLLFSQSDCMIRGVFCVSLYNIVSVDPVPKEFQFCDREPRHCIGGERRTRYTKDISWRHRGILSDEHAPISARSPSRTRRKACYSDHPRIKTIRSGRIVQARRIF